MADFWISDIDGFYQEIRRLAGLPHHELVAELAACPEWRTYLAGTCAPGFQLYARLWPAEKAKPLQAFLQWDEKARNGVSEGIPGALDYWAEKLIGALEWMASSEPASNARQDLKDEFKAFENEKRIRKELEFREGLISFYASIPALYRNASISDFGEGSRLIGAFLSGTSAIIYGGNGIGKTHLAWALTKHWRETEKDLDRVAVFSTFDVFCSIISAMSARQYRAGVDVAEEMFVRKCSHLILDECDKTDMADSAFRNFSHVIGRRYEEGLQTILICNAVDEADARKKVGDSVFSRFRSKSWNAEIIELTGEDKRKDH